MKAAVYYQNGGPEVFRHEDVADPVCGSDEVLIRVEAISVEGGDLVNREIRPLARVPHVVGYQCAGTITEAGRDVRNRRVGDRVVAILSWGSHAQYAAAPAADTWIIPENLNLDTAAAIPVAWGTAYECLFTAGELKQAETVLIHAGAGALGLAAIQLAKRAGARVLATASDDSRLEQLKRFGLDLGINYKNDDFVEKVMADKLKEVGRFGCAQPDWGGQMAYDIVTDSFYMNAWTVADARFSSTIGPAQIDLRPLWPLPHRSLIKIGMAGDQTEMPDGVINVFPEVWPAYIWGNSTWAFSNTVYGWPACTYDVPFSVNRPTGKQGSQRQAQVIPISQPSTSGLIAALFPGIADFSSVGAGWQDRSSWAGYAFLWSTVTQQVVWRGQGLGTALPALGADDNSFDFSRIFDPWATITPAGNAIFSIAGKITPVQIGSVAPITAPPAGCVGIAVTNGDTQAYAISPTGAYHYHAGKWGAIHLGGTGAPHSVLHDLVTDAVAIVMDDASGVWIFNGYDGLKRPLAPFKVGFARPPNRDPRMFYPQQFINGALLITYALPWDGTRGSTGTAYIIHEFIVVTGSVTFQFPSQPGQPRGMAAHYIVGQQPPTPWRAELGRVGSVIVTLELAHGGGTIQELSIPNPDSAFDGSIDPVPWVIGRYDIGQLTATST